MSGVSFGRRQQAINSRGLVARNNRLESGVADRLLFVTVVLMSCGLWIITGRDDTGADGGSPLTNSLWAATYLMAFAGVVAERKVALHFARASTPLVILLMLVCLSTLWSDQPAQTARRSLELLGTGGLSLYFVCRLGLRQFVSTLAITITIMAAVSLMLIAFVPSVGYWVDAWGGMFSSKNFLGPAMVLGMLTTVSLMDTSRSISRLLKVAVLITYLVLLLGSKNVGGIGTAIALVLTIPVLLWTRKTRSLRLALLFGFILSIVWIFAWASGIGIDDIISVFGRDATLSGRTDLWQLLVEAIAERPILGYGYSVFWGTDGPAGRLIYPAIGWSPATAHNGFLEVALNVGLIGELLLILFLVVGLWRAGVLFWRGDDWLSGWPLFTIMYMILSNLSNATFETYGAFDWIVVVAAFLFASDARQRRISAEPLKRDFGAVGSRQGASEP